MAASILLVDDERDFVEAMAERLRLRGLQTDTACDAAGALDRLRRGGVEVVVLDVQMPGRTGIEAMEDMRALDPAVQIVLLTGQASVGSAVEGMKRGAFDYLTKPAEVDNLAETIRRAQGRYGSLAESLRMQETAKLALVGQLAEGVAHEINTPLSVITQSAGWLLELLDDPPPESRFHAELRSSLENIARHGKRCGEITRKLLRFAGRIDHRRREVHLENVIRQVAEGEEPPDGVRLQLDIAADLPPVLASPMEMEEVLRNLLRNALEAMRGRTGRVTVRAAAGGDGVDVSVADQGPGIAPEHRARIFEPFYSTKEVGQGTGLGLAICFGIITSLGGTIGFESPPGQGATFRFRLPALLRPGS